ncbi:hypothetical protein ACFV1F_17135 [Streptomyces sp. NPDC059590]|uniref:hypothetical protein n=1 Tax=Streptomyces sp. NPDC059590 TaxID=3346877 RepID=UPI0036B80F41
MANQPSSQIAPAAALGQLLQEHPELPKLEWSIPRNHGVLKGSLYADDHPFEVLRAYADVLGGSIRPDTGLGADFESAGLRRRVHRLTATWRDVPVVVEATATVGLCGTQYLPGQLAEQRHQLGDAAVPTVWAVTA